MSAKPDPTMPRFGSLEYFQWRTQTSLSKRRRFRNLATITALTYIGINLAADVLNIFEHNITAFIFTTINLAVAVTGGVFVGRYAAIVDTHRRDATYLDIAQSTTPQLAEHALKTWIHKDHTEPCNTCNHTPPNTMVPIHGCYNPDTTELNVWDKHSGMPNFFTSITLNPDDTGQPRLNMAAQFGTTPDQEP